MCTNTPRPFVYGPTEPSMLTLRGIRLLAPPDDEGANGGGDNGGGNDDDNSNGGGNSGGQGNDGGNDDDRRSSNGGGSNSSSRRQGNDDRGRARDGSFSREYVTELRNENGARRRNEAALQTRAETAETERDQARARIADLERRDAIRGAAGDGGANPDVLLDSDRFRQETKDLDLGKRDDVVDAIKKFVQANPYAATAPQGAGSSGPGRAGGQSNDGPKNENNLRGAVSAALGGGSRT